MTESSVPPALKAVSASMHSYCKVPVKEELLGDLLPGPVTLVFERSEALNADLNPFTSVSPLPEMTSLKMKTSICCSHAGVLLSS